MPRHEWFLGPEAALALRSIPRRSADSVLRLIASLADNPDCPADEEFHRGRRDFIRVKQFDSWRITWWIDAPVKEIQILAIEKVRRSR